MGIRIAVLASGRGSNLVAIMHSIAEGKIDGKIAVVLSDKEEAKALEHAKNAGIATYHVNPKAYDTKEAYEKNYCALLERQIASLFVWQDIAYLESIFYQSGTLPCDEYSSGFTASFSWSAWTETGFGIWGESGRMHCAFCG